MCIGTVSSEFALCKALAWLLLPEMPFAPPESDYGDISNGETSEHLEQFQQEH